MTIPTNATSGNKRKSKKFIKSLMKIKKTTPALLKRVKSDCCSICINDFDVDERVCFLKCNHIFHKNCIMKWLLKKNTCPLCRCKLQLHENDDYTDTDIDTHMENMNGSFDRFHYAGADHINFWTSTALPLANYGTRDGFMSTQARYCIMHGMQIQYNNKYSSCRCKLY